MAKMQSWTLMNVQHQQVGLLQPTQSAPNLTHNAMRNELAGTANNSCQYQVVNSRVQPPQSSNSVLQNGIYSNRQTTNWQPSAGPHQTVSSQQKCHKTNSPYLVMLLTNPSTDIQSKNLSTAQLTFQQNSATQSQPNKMTGNTTNNHLNASSHLMQLAAVNGRQSVRIQEGQKVSHLQHSKVLKGCYPNSNGDSRNPGSTYTTTVTSLTREHTSVSATAHNRRTAQAAHSHAHKQNSPQLRFSPSIPQVGYNMSTSWPLVNNSIPTHSSSSTQMLYVAQLSSACNSGGDSTIFSNTNSCNQLANTNQLSLNPAVTHQQILRNNVSADGSQLLYTTGYTCPPPPYRSAPYQWPKFANNARMTNMRPVALAGSESRNLSNTQPLSLQSGQSLPKSSQSCMSRSENFANLQRQQNSVPNVSHATATGDGSLNGKADIAIHLSNNTASKGNPVGPLSSGPQVMQLSEGISPQRNKTHSSVANNQELLKITSSVKQNDGSIHSSPGRSGMRAVAVVQPLSLESCQNVSTTSNAATEESLLNPDKVFVSPDVAKNGNDENLTKESNLYQGNQNQLQSNKSVTSCSTASNDGALFSKSDSGPQNVMQKSALDVSIAKTDKQSEPVPVPVPVHQNCSEDQGEMVKPPTPPVLRLSSLPPSQWTINALTELIKKTEKQETKPDDSGEVHLVRKILGLFWDGSCRTLLSQLRRGWYRAIMTEVLNFYDTHIKTDTVIMSKEIGRQKLEKYHLLKDDEVHSEQPYKSSWLNLNEQLDDIDKEFGFPETLKYPLHEVESDNQTDQETVNSIPEPVVNEVPDKVLFPTELEPVDSVEEKQSSTAEAPSTQTASSNETESVSSNDPLYSFNIQVLPPEEAKHFFEQVQTEIPQSMDTDSQAEKVIGISVESEIPEGTDATLSILEDEACDPIEQVCCITRLVEIFSGESTPSKCLCKKQQNDNKCTDETLDKEEEVMPKDNSLFENSSYRIFDLTMEEENPEKDKENTDDQIITLCSSEPCHDVIQIFDLTDDKGEHDSSFDQESVKINNSKSSVVSITDNECEDLANSENEIPTQVPKLVIELSESEGECEQEQLKPTGTMQSSASVSDGKQTESTEIDVAIQMSEYEEGCPQVDVAESLLETKGPIQTSATADLQMFSSRCTEHETTLFKKLKRLSSHDTFSPLLKKSKKCKFSVDRDSECAFEGVSKRQKNLADAAETQPLTSNVRTVELVLFGSAQQEKCAGFGAKKSNVSFQRGVSTEAQRPPEVVSVNLNPLKRKSSDAVYRGEQSFKEWIHEKWRRSLPPTKIRHRNKLKRKKCSYASVPGESLKREKSEMKVLNSRRCMSLKRKTSHPNGLKLGKAKKLKQQDGHERSYTKNGSNTIRPLQENVLKFCVLPKTFDFKDGSNRRKESTGPASDKPERAKEKNQRSSKTTTEIKGTWYPNPEKRYKPICPSPVPKTSNLFHEFQKIYKKKTQSSTDE